jgi:hypothetical protein
LVVDDVKLSVVSRFEVSGNVSPSCDIIFRGNRSNRHAITNGLVAYVNLDVVRYGGVSHLCYFRLSRPVHGDRKAENSGDTDNHSDQGTSC